MEEEDDGEGWRGRIENLMNQYKKKCEYIYIKSTRQPFLCPT
jgi:hypothetical protein